MTTAGWLLATLLLALLTAAFYQNGYYLAAVFAGWCGGVTAKGLYEEVFHVRR